MEIISKQVESVKKSWGTQKVENVKYRAIKYLLKATVEEGLLLQNTVTGELVLINGEELKLFNSLPAEYNEGMRDLVEHRFLVPVDYDEYKEVKNLRKILQLFAKEKHITGYTILPTTCCNARCFYCYESDYEHLTMSEQTANEVVDFIASHCGDEKKVTLSWFGGEPTLGVNRIRQICNGLNSKEIEYSCSMISNGYLFNEELVKEAKELWKLKTIQITLDGTEEIYNKVKSYVGIKESAYKKVLNNIELILKNDIRVSVRMNLDRHNYEDLKLLISELKTRFAEYKNFSCYVWPLFDDCGYKKVEHSTDDIHWLLAKKNELNNFINDNKIQREYDYLPYLKFSICMATNNSSIIINPDGSFSKCEHFCTKENAGNLKDGVTNYKLLEEWKQVVVFEKCKDCALLPNCYLPKNCVSAGYCFEEKTNKELADFISVMIKRFNSHKKEEVV